MKHVGKSTARAIVNIGFAAHDFGNHRQAADRSGKRVGGADCHQVAVEVGFALPRIEQVDRLGAQERFEAADQGEEQHVF